MGQIQASSGWIGHPGSLALGLALLWLIRWTWWERDKHPTCWLGGWVPRDGERGWWWTVAELSVSLCHCRAIHMPFLLPPTPTNANSQAAWSLGTVPIPLRSS